MCDALIVAGAGMQLAGMLTQIKAVQDRSNFAQGVARRNAAMASAAAGDALSRAAVTGLRTALRGSAVVAAQRVGLSASGGDVNTGGGAEVERDTRLFTDIDEATIRRNASLEAYGYRAKAQEFQQEGEFARAEGENAVLSSVLGGVGKMALGVGKAWLDVPDSAGTADTTTAMLSGDSIKDPTLSLFSGPPKQAMGIDEEDYTPWRPRNVMIPGLPPGSG